MNQKIIYNYNNPPLLPKINRSKTIFNNPSIVKNIVNNINTIKSVDIELKEKNKYNSVSIEKFIISSKYLTDQDLLSILVLLGFNNITTELYNIVDIIYTLLKLGVHDEYDDDEVSDLSKLTKEQLYNILPLPNKKQINYYTYAQLLLSAYYGKNLDINSHTNYDTFVAGNISRHKILRVFDSFVAGNISQHKILQVFDNYSNNIYITPYAVVNSSSTYRDQVKILNFLNYETLDLIIDRYDLDFPIIIKDKNDMFDNAFETIMSKDFSKILTRDPEDLSIDDIYTNSQQYTPREITAILDIKSYYNPEGEGQVWNNYNNIYKFINTTSLTNQWMFVSKRCNNKFIKVDVVLSYGDPLTYNCYNAQDLIKNLKYEQERYVFILETIDDEVVFEIEEIERLVNFIRLFINDPSNRNDNRVPILRELYDSILKKTRIRQSFEDKELSFEYKNLSNENKKYVDLFLVWLLYIGLYYKGWDNYDTDKLGYNNFDDPIPYGYAKILYLILKEPMINIIKNDYEIKNIITSMFGIKYKNYNDTFNLDKHKIQLVKLYEIIKHNLFGNRDDMWKLNLRLLRTALHYIVNIHNIKNDSQLQKFINDNTQMLINQLKAHIGNFTTEDEFLSEIIMVDFKAIINNFKIPQIKLSKINSNDDINLDVNKLNREVNKYLGK